jgi:alpha-L-glutamate ligase-like protein
MNEVNMKPILRHCLFGSRRLRERGVLGINRRNAEFILDGNPRPAIALADDKLRVHRLCLSIGVPTPGLIAVVRRHAEVRPAVARIGAIGQCVIKPARGFGGRGVLVVENRNCDAELLSDHLSDILSGMFSLGGQQDFALIQQRVQPHPALRSLAVGGLPDIRIIVHCDMPIMAMLRLPTTTSRGRANLHQGGLGVGIEMTAGRTHHAVHGNVAIRRHPDTGENLIGFSIPMWGEMLDLSRRIARAVGLGYAGVDIVLDPVRGPLLLEVNSRPGLAIQNANGRGLLSGRRVETSSLSREAESAQPSAA